MTRRHPRWSILLGAFVGLCVAFSASGGPVSMYGVSINTSGINGTAGAIAFDFLRNDPSSNTLDILNFSTDATLGLPVTQGGLVEGDLILGDNPAPFTRINGGSFFNELLLPTMPFRNTIKFTLSLSGNYTPGAIPDEVAFFLLDASGLPIFPTSDPLGANALFSIDINGIAGGALNVFAPTVQSGPVDLQIIVPESQAVPEPTTLMLVSLAFAILMIVGRLRSAHTMRRRLARD